MYQRPGLQLFLVTKDQKAYPSQSFSCLLYMTMISAYKRIAWNQLLPFNSKHVTLKFQKH